MRTHVASGVGGLLACWLAGPLTAMAAVWVGRQDARCRRRACGTVVMDGSNAVTHAKGAPSTQACSQY